MPSPIALIPMGLLLSGEEERPLSLNDSAMRAVEFRVSSGYFSLKRALDIAGSGLLLVALSPLLIGVAILIVAIDRQSPFYLDARVGRGGRLFRCWKFQTMRSDPTILERYFEANPEERQVYELTRKLMDDPRKTALGSFLRRTSIDEFPQLWNVLRGEMSLVGPRPITEREFARRPLTDQAWMASVRPGMTGLWQVSGRCDTDDETRIALDSRYAREWSMGMDLMILLRTPIAVTGTRGAR